MPQSTFSMTNNPLPCYITPHDNHKRRAMTSGVYPRKEKPMEDRFWSYVDKTSSCWLWTGCKTSFGYGSCYNGSFNPLLKRKARIGAHRVSYEIHYGKIPAGMCVLHKCDVPACVNPNHLFLGTKLDNMIDKENKNRGNHKTKLTPDVVLKIRLSNSTQREIAKQYDISQSAVSMIKNGLRWSNVA